jgi:hypothetical protein
MFIVPADRLRTGKGRKGRSGKCGAQIARGRLRVDRDAAKKASCFRKKNRSTDLQTCASEQLERHHRRQEKPDATLRVVFLRGAQKRTRATVETQASRRASDE